MLRASVTRSTSPNRSPISAAWPEIAWAPGQSPSTARCKATGTSRCPRSAQSRLAVVEQPARPREPAAGAGELAAVHQDEDQPARAAGGPQHVAPAQELAMRTLPHLDAVLIPADQVRRRGEPLEVLRLERGLPISGGQLGEGIRPRPPVEGLPAALDVPRPSSRPRPRRLAGHEGLTRRAQQSLGVARHESILRPPRPTVAPEAPMTSRVTQLHAQRGGRRPPASGSRRDSPRCSDCAEPKRGGATQPVGIAGGHQGRGPVSTARASAAGRTSRTGRRRRS